ncbi:MAG TPA: ABC transporter permease subunit [Galbitalea sp.]|jgi:osmoprotectant transport system permease protein|nr:ABC transporter permease subunit [Galbitalea sp.]
MNLITAGFAWIFDPAHWSPSSTSVGISEALVNHLLLTGLSLLVTAVIALPVGLFIGHSGKGRGVAIIASNISRAIPSLGLLTVLGLIIPDIRGIPTNLIADVIVFVLLGIPSMLAGAYAGLESVDRETIDAARAIGMTEWQILFTVEIPLGANLIVGGIRSTTLQIVATVTIASFLGQLSLGTFLIDGLTQGNYVKMLGGAILVAALALLLDGLLAAIQRLVSPRGVSRGKTTARSNTARGIRTTAATQGTPMMEGNR